MVPMPLGDAAPSGRYDPQTAEVSLETQRNGIIPERANTGKRRETNEKRREMLDEQVSEKGGIYIYI